MTYGLVYKPINVFSDILSPSRRSYIESEIILPNEEKIRFNSTVRETIENIVDKDAIANATNDADKNDRRNSFIIYDKVPFFVEDTPEWPLNAGNISRRYEVYENDSEIEGSSHKIKIHSGHGRKHDGKKKNMSKKNKIKGTTLREFKGKEKGKKGGHEDEEHEEGKYAGQKSGYTSYGKKRGKYNKNAHKKKQGEHKHEKKSKKYRKKKGFKDKWNLDKEDKVHKFWKNHQEEGEFHVFGLKKKHKNANEKDGKKHKWKKKQEKKHRKSSSNNLKN